MTAPPCCGDCGAVLSLSRDPARLFRCAVCEPSTEEITPLRGARERVADLLGGTGCLGLALLAWVIAASLGVR